MSYFDMVANPVSVPAQEKISLERLKQGVIKLKKDKEDGKFCINGVEWKRSVNDVLTTHDLEMFLMKDCNIPAPAAQAQELQWKKQADSHSMSQLTKVQTQMKERKIKEEIVKKESLTGAEEAFDKLNVPPSTPAREKKKKKKQST